MPFTNKYLNDNRYHGGKMSKVRAVIIHHTAGHFAGDIAVLRGKTKRRVSVQYYVAKSGLIYRLLPYNTKAWHAGVSRLGWRVGCNNFTVGIEIENLGNGRDPYPVCQLDSVAECIREIDHKVGGKAPIYGHKEVCIPKGRKTDPSKNFPLAAFKKHRTWHAPATPPPPKPTTLLHIREVTTAGLNLRKSPMGKVVKVLPKGKRVRVLGSTLHDGDRWYRVSVLFGKNRYAGWVRGKFTRKV